MNAATWRERLAAAAQPRQPWLRLRLPPFWARVLVVAGARPARPFKPLEADPSKQVPSDFPTQFEGVTPRSRWRASAIGAAVGVLACAVAVVVIKPGGGGPHSVTVIVQAGETTPIATASTSPDATAGSSPSAITSLPTSGPVSVVEAYYNAINRGDYATAWNLGGANFGESYATFETSFSNTARIVVTITSVAGNDVGVKLSVTGSDGTVKTYAGTYTVTDGTITGADLALTN